MPSDRIIEWIGKDQERVRVEFLTDRTVRIRIRHAGRFSDSALNRYGFIAEPAGGGEAPVSTRAPDGTPSVTTSGIGVHTGTEGGPLRITNGRGDTILHMVDATVCEHGAVARFRALPEEDWVGFGDQARDHLYHRGRIADLHVRNVRSYIPVPFFMSTAGVGVLVNTTHRIVFDMCASDPDHFEWRDGRGTIDFYVMAGDSFRDLLHAYTELTGRPKLPPEWSFGLWYICRTQANDFEVVNDAANFRREGIPCDVIGLEPGWMEKSYDGSLDKTWSRDRFPIPSYAQTGPHNFFNALYRMGFRLELWLCCDYDLTHEAERRIGGPGSSREAAENTGFFQADAELDEHFSQPRYADPVTRPERPWFQHLEPFVDQGVSFFKQDGAYQVLDHPDRLWGNGMGDEEVHNLYPLLYARQMLEGFEQHTGRRGLTFTPCGWAGFQAWAGTWTGDTGGGPQTLGAMLNTAMVGHSWATNDMEVTELEALHFGYLLPWAQINSWNYFRMPWAQGEKLLDAHKAYSRLRARLIPYIYSYAWQATRTGYPLIAPLALEFQDDPECREILLQFLLGRDLLVCAFEPDVYLPAGSWKDLWTGEVLHGGGKRTLRCPSDRGGGLLLREGAIVPFGPLMQYRGEKPVDEVELHVFPAEQASRFTLYEDDGISLAHREGAFTTTRIEAEKRDGAIRLRVAAAEGDFEGRAKNRRWAFRIAVAIPPRAITCNGVDLGTDEWSFDPDRGELLVPPRPDRTIELIVTPA